MLPHPVSLKRYHTLDAALKAQFGQKVSKLSIDAGFTCPNRDGTISANGCAFCGVQGSGDFTGKGTIGMQMVRQAETAYRKWGDTLHIAYFQAFTNTYAPIEKLEQKYREALTFPKTVGLAIATRPDCLPNPVLVLLEKLNQETFLWVELGLQTIHEATATSINRGYTHQIFLEAAVALNQRGIRWVVHLIAGLPCESKSMFLDSIQTVAQLRPWGIKLHMLHVTRDAPLARQFSEEPFPLLTKDDYVDWIVEALALLPKETVVHRLTGDGNAKTLLAPDWTRDKLRVLSAIDLEMEKRGYRQGCLFSQQ